MRHFPYAVDITDVDGNTIRLHERTESAAIGLAESVWDRKDTVHVTVTLKRTGGLVDELGYPPPTY